MQFADFASTGFNPIVNLLAKSHYRWGQEADVVTGQPQHHPGSLEVRSTTWDMRYEI